MRSERPISARRRDIFGTKFRSSLRSSGKRPTLRAPASQRHSVGEICAFRIRKATNSGFSAGKQNLARAYPLQAASRFIHLFAGFIDILGRDRPVYREVHRFNFAAEEEQLVSEAGARRRSGQWRLRAPALLRARPVLDLGDGFLSERVELFHSLTNAVQIHEDRGRILPHIEQHRGEAEFGIGDITHIWSRTKRSPEQGSRKLRSDAPATTMRAEHHGKIKWRYALTRRISLREQARLQSFPDDFRFPCTMRETERQIGNAVLPVLAWHLAKALQSQVFS